MIGLLVPCNVWASNNLYSKVFEMLIEKYGEPKIKHGQFFIEPILNEPTASFEPDFDADRKLECLYADMESTFAPPTATKTYRTAAYQYWVTPSINEVNYIPAHTRP
ncbi:MAG: hypothetical protein GX790_02355 [Syntrophomonadaceae bacterium]|nr:hypothetical protein [Syntrophomonadaceae bacterium]